MGFLVNSETRHRGSEQPSLKWAFLLTVKRDTQKERTTKSRNSRKIGCYGDTRSHFTAIPWTISRPWRNLQVIIESEDRGSAILASKPQHQGSIQATAIFEWRIILPHPRSPGGKPQRLTARVKIASCVCVRVSPQSDVPNLGANAVLVAPSNAATQISSPAEEASM